MTVNFSIIGVGSNIDPENNVRAAKENLARTVTILAQSAFVYTAPLLDTEQDRFLNGAFLIRSPLEQESLKQHLKRIEIEMGRVKTKNKNGPRPIDLDIIAFNHAITDNDVYERDFLRDSILELLPTLRNHGILLNVEKLGGQGGERI